jgi:hypothetical protein
MIRPPDTDTVIDLVDRADPHTRGMRVRMPADFTAFCQLHSTHYLHYARIRLQDASTSRIVVERALGDLATLWPRALRSPATADFAWHTLASRVTAATTRLPDEPRAPDGLHRLLAAPEADAVICHRLMGLTINSTAFLQGVPAEIIIRHLRTAADSLGAELAHLFGLRKSP